MGFIQRCYVMWDGGQDGLGYLDATANVGDKIKDLGAEQRAARNDHTAPITCGLKATLQIAAPQLPASTVERVKRWEKRRAT